MSPYSHFSRNQLVAGKRAQGNGEDCDQWSVTSIWRSGGERITIVGDMLDEAGGLPTANGILVLFPSLVALLGDGRDDGAILRSHLEPADSRSGGHREDILGMREAMQRVLPEVLGDSDDGGD